MKAPQQLASVPCGLCDGTVAVAPTESPFEFNWRCSSGRHAGVISWAHSSAPPVYVRSRPGSDGEDVALPFEPPPPGETGAELTEGAASAALASYLETRSSR